MLRIELPVELDVAKLDLETVLFGDDEYWAVGKAEGSVEDIIAMADCWWTEGDGRSGLLNKDLFTFPDVFEMLFLGDILWTEEDILLPFVDEVFFLLFEGEVEPEVEVTDVVHDVVDVTEGDELVAELGFFGIVYL